MHAIRQYEFGPPENLRYEEVEDPRPGPGQVRIAVRAAGIHLIDTTIRAGIQGGWSPLPELPMTPGREVAGVIDEIGPGVEQGWLGRRVVANLGNANGGYAELAVSDVASLHALPGELAEDVAVAMIGTGRTTIGILDVARPTGDDVVLVMAAAGGIGALAIQAARSAGATVVGAAGGAAKVGVARRLGADVAVDYTEPDWTQAVRDELGGREVTLLLDGVGGPSGLDGLDLLAVGGRVVLYGGASGSQTEITTADLYRRGITASVGIGARLLRRPDGMRGLEERALAAAATGRLVPLVGQSFPLAKAADAHRAMETRATVGKAVLEP